MSVMSIIQKIGDRPTFVNVKWFDITPKDSLKKVYTLDLATVDQEKELLTMQGHKTFFIGSPKTNDRLFPKNFVQMGSKYVEKDYYDRWSLEHDDGQLILYRKKSNETTS